jgi:hypothetical protein
VKFKTNDELEAVASVAIWARQQIGHDDPRWKAISLMYGYFTSYGIQMPVFTRISAQDLEILAPFIDRFIEGKGPPSILSVEYEVWQPAALKSFKARMKIEGWWPESSYKDNSQSAGVQPPRA